MHVIAVVFGDITHSDSDTQPCVHSGRWRNDAHRPYSFKQFSCLDTNCLDYAAQALALHKCDGDIMVIACKQAGQNHLCCLWTN